MNIDALDHLVLTVRDSRSTADFYRRVLGMEVITFGPGRVALRFGQQKINLHPVGQEFAPHAHAHAPTPGSADLCLITPTPLEQVIAQCQSLDVEIIEGPVARAIAPLKSIYIRDPDLNLIEIANRLSPPETSITDWQLPHRFTFEGQPIAYGIEGQGPPLVLVHGTPWSSFNWRHLIPALAQHWTVYFYDLLGYGHSEQREGQDVSLQVQNRVLAGLLDHWQLETPPIIGHDFGGTTVLRTHLLEQRDFQHIVLVDPVAVAPWGSSFFAHVRMHQSAFQGIPDYIHEAMVTAYVRGAMHKPMPAETLQGILRPWQGDMGQPAFYRQIAQADQRFTDEIEPLYAKITRPVLLVWGEEDTWIPSDRGRQLQQQIPQAQWVSIPNAGHLVQEDAPAALLTAIQSFLQG